MANQLINLFGALGLDATLQAIRDRLPASLGKKTAANSLSVTFASDESALNIAGAVDDGTASSGKMLLVGGQTAAGVAQVLETNASGHLHVADGGGSLTVDSSTLASEATNANIEILIDTLVSLISTLNASLPRLDAVGRQVVNNSEVTQPVSGTVTANIGTGSLANITSIGGQQVPYFAFEVPLYIYDNIKVS